MKLMELLNVVPNGAVICHRTKYQPMVVYHNSVIDFTTREEVKFGLEELSSELWFEHPFFNRAVTRMDFKDYPFDPLEVSGEFAARRMEKTVAIMNLIACTGHATTDGYKGKYCYVPVRKDGKWENHRINQNTPAIFGTTTPDSCQQVCDYLNRNKW